MFFWNKEDCKLLRILVVGIGIRASIIEKNQGKEACKRYLDDILQLGVISYDLEPYRYEDSKKLLKDSIALVESCNIIQSLKSKEGRQKIKQQLRQSLPE